LHQSPLSNHEFEMVGKHIVFGRKQNEYQIQNGSKQLKLKT